MDQPIEGRGGAKVATLAIPSFHSLHSPHLVIMNDIMNWQIMTRLKVSNTGIACVPTAKGKDTS